MTPIISSFPLLATPVSLPGGGLLPLVALALALDGAIVAVWYLTGFVLGNRSVRGAAKEEFYQLVGTAVMIAIIIGALATFSGIFYSSLSATKLMSPSAMTTMCNNLQNGHGLDLLSGNPSILNPKGTSAAPPFPGLCSLVSQQSKPSLMSQIDYPLAATSVIIANVTNQTVSNLNSTFVFDSFIGFFSQLAPQVTFCVPSVEGPLPASVADNGCVNPLAEEPAPALTIYYSAQPQEGFDLIFTNMITYGTLMGAATESLLAQLLITAVLMNFWPFLLFAGIILRAVFYTRKVGGLLIAMAIGIVMFFPAVYAFEYLAMANGVPASAAQTYGLGGQPGSYIVPTSADPNTFTTYSLNFFNQPRLNLLFQHYQCWPMLDNKPVPPSEAYIYDAAALDIPNLASIPLLQGTTGGPLGFVPVLSLPSTCAQGAALNAFLALVGTYGIVGIAAFLLPIVNLFIFLTGMLGLSGLMGGDTSLAGLAKII